MNRPTTAPHDDLALPRRTMLGAALAALSGIGSVALSGCGGGDSDPTAQAQSIDDRRQIQGVDSGGTGWIDESYFSATIEAVAPLTVGSVRFGVAPATRLTDADGVRLAPSSLAPGMTCRIQASAVTTVGAQQQAVAHAIVIGEQALGPVQAVDPASGTLTLLDQQVVVAADTPFGGLASAGLANVVAGTVLRIWGQLDVAGGRILATRVDAAPLANAFVVRGVLSTIDRSSGHIDIGGLSAVSSDPALLPAGLSAGTVVRARLQSLPGAAGWSLLALRADPLTVPDRPQVEIDGRVTRYMSAVRFAVDGVDVVAATAVLGADAPVALGVHVVVRGSARGGVLYASSVQTQADAGDGLTALDGRITRLDASVQSFELQGVTVDWTASTVVEGGVIGQLRAHPQVSVRGRPSADGLRLLAQSIRLAP